MLILHQKSNNSELCKKVIVLKLLSILPEKCTSILITSESKQFSVTPKRYYTQIIGSNFVSKTQFGHVQSFDTKILKTLIALTKLTT